MKVIKIFSKSQLILLRNINPLLGKYKLPPKILKRMDYILEDANLGKHGFLIVVMTPVKGDIREIEDAVNAYPFEAEFLDEVDWQETLGADRIGGKNKGMVHGKALHQGDGQLHLCAFLYQEKAYVQNTYMIQQQ